jgi:hypothetical protein
MLSKATNNKQPLQQRAMMQANPKYVVDQPMLTPDQLCEAGQHCIDLHNYYIRNYKTGKDIIVSFKDHHFLVGDNVFVITFSDLYNFFDLNVLDISLMSYFAL